MSEVRALPRERVAFGDMTNSLREFVCAPHASTLRITMGSLVKKRRKRMRKKKHRKMLKRTRFQRRAAGK